MTPKILILPGSTRSGSLNTRLAACAAAVLAQHDAEVTQLSLADYPMPIFNGDEEAKSGAPEAAQALARMFAAQDGILLVSPEYNAGITPLMKNTLDWISRVRKPGQSPFSGDRVFALAAASPGGFGGMRSLLMMRQTLEVGLGALVLPQMFSLPRAANAFDNDGGLADEQHRERLVGMLDTFMLRVRQLRAWNR